LPNQRRPTTTITVAYRPIHTTTSVVTTDKEVLKAAYVLTDAWTQLSQENIIIEPSDQSAAKTLMMVIEGTHVDF